MIKVLNRLLPVSLAVAAVAFPTAQADVIGGSVEASYWAANYSGKFVSGNSTIDVEDDLGFDDGGFVELSASFEHPIPVLPNLRVRHIDLDETENGSLTTTFDGQTFSGDVTTNLDLTHTDLVLYYEILDNYVSVDAGLDIKVFDGQLDIQQDGSSNRSTTKIDDVVPMLYVGASVELPLTGLSAGADVSAINYSDSSLTDAKIRIRQGFGPAFLELGYRQMSIDIEDISDVDVDSELSGAYLSTGLDF